MGRDKPETKKAYYEKHKEEILEGNRARWKKNSDKYQASQKKYRETHKEEIRQRGREWRENNREHYREYQRNIQKKYRIEAFIAYGGPKCVCCGETLLEGLTLDHIYGGGLAHRKQIRSTNIFFWLRQKGYPPGYQVLCATCNQAKGGKDHCPHQEMRG